MPNEQPTSPFEIQELSEIILSYLLPAERRKMRQLSRFFLQIDEDIASLLPEQQTRLLLHYCRDLNNLCKDRALGYVHSLEKYLSPKQRSHIPSLEHAAIAATILFALYNIISAFFPTVILKKIKLNHSHKNLISYSVISVTERPPWQIVYLSLFTRQKKNLIRLLY